MLREVRPLPPLPDLGQNASCRMDNASRGDYEAGLGEDPMGGGASRRLSLRGRAAAWDERMRPSA